MEREILDFTYRPKADRKRGNAVFYTLVSISVILVMLSVMMARYKGIVSFVAVGFFTAALAVYSRYLIGEYAYVVANCGEGSVMLIVTKTTGKRVSTLCNLPLASVKEVRYSPSQTLKREKFSRGVKTYNFCPTMSPPYMILVIADTGREKMRIFLEGSEALARRLSEDARSALVNLSLKNSDD